MQVFLSEDSSGIVKKVVYNSKSDQLIGLVLPIDNKNGMPIPRMFKADSPESIKRHLENPQSSLMYVVVAQPLKEKVAPFVLQLFGTDNRFKTEDVLKRWIHTEKELKRFVENWHFIIIIFIFEINSISCFEMKYFEISIYPRIYLY